MPVTHGVASSSLVQTAKRVDELVSSALFCKIEDLDSLDRINTKLQQIPVANKYKDGVYHYESTSEINSKIDASINDALSLLQL